MELTAQQKLEGMLKEMFPSLAKDIMDVIEKQKEEIAALKESGVEQKSLIEQLQKDSMKRIKLAVPGTDITVPAMYKGRRIDGMGAQIGVAPEYREAIAKMYVDLFETRFKHGTAAIQVAADYLTKDLTEGTADTVGYLVFPEYINQVLAFARLKSLALQECRIINVATDTIYLPMESTSVNAYWINEAAPITQSEPVVGQLTLTPKKLAAFSVLSNELLADSAFDLVSWLTELFAEAIATELDNQIFNGTAFTGLISTITNSVSAGGAVSLTDLSNLIDSIPSNKNVNAKLYMHRNGFKLIRTLKDDANNAVYSPATSTKPNSVWEVPVVLNEMFPSDTTTGLSPIMVYGNMKDYIIAARKTGVTLEADPYGLFTKDQTRFRVVTRYHGKPWNVSGFAKMIA
jgi:HK97 family phage major capsid protein